MKQDKVIALAAGGTGGHIFPALAVALALRKHNYRLLWLGAGAMEQEVAQAAGIEFHKLPMRKFRGQFYLARLMSLLALVPAYWRASKLLRQHQPVGVISFGGFAALPTALASIGKPAKLFIMEQNAIAGWSNRLALLCAHRAFSAFAGALPESKTLISGNPLRPEFSHSSHPSERYQSNRGRLRLALMGGSQGAQALNECLARSYAKLEATQRKQIQIKHQCGKHLVATQELYGAAASEVELVESWAQPLPVYLWADLIICRAGAMTISEISAVGVAALLVPYPYAAGDHQYANACQLVEQDAAWLCPQRDFSVAWLSQFLLDLIQKPVQHQRQLLQQLALRAYACGRRDATSSIVATIQADLQPGTN